MEEEEANLDRWIATAIEDLSRLDANDGGHGFRFEIEMRSINSCQKEEMKQLFVSCVWVGGVVSRGLIYTLD